MIRTALALVLLLTLPAWADVQVGVARETFDLPRGVPLAGYSRRHGKPSRGVHDPVGVRALVLDDGTTHAALVSCDLLVIDESLADAVREQLIGATRLPPDLVLMLAATHTHSGPGAYGSRFLEKVSMGHFDQAVFDELARTIARAITRAYQDRGPARMAAQSARTQGLVTNRSDPGGLIDDELGLVIWYREGSPEPFALLVTFAAHATTLGSWNMKLSADYPGVVVRELERRFPSSTALFFAGAVGDQAPVKSGEGVEPMERLGLALAEAAERLMAQAKPEVPERLMARTELMPLPRAAVRLGGLRLPSWLGRTLVDDDAALSLLAVDRTVFIGVPCDLTASLGARLKAAARADGAHPIIVGFANDYIGYCLPERLYASNTYEASMAFNGPKAGELIVERLIRMIGAIAATRDKQQATSDR